MINYSIIDGIEANEEVMVDEEVMKVEKINDEFPSEVIGNNMTRITYAASKGMVLTVRDCLRLTADLSLTYPLFYTPALIEAATQGHYEVVKLLLCFGAASNHTNNYHDTALTCAAMKGHTDIVSLLLDYGADINACSKSEETALLLAIKHGRKAVAKLFIDRGADINRPLASGITPLMVSIDYYRQDIFNWLLAEADLNLEAADQTGMTALMLSIYCRCGEYFFQELLKRRANVNVCNQAGNSPLVIAVELDKVNFVKDLLQNGADKNAHNNDGDTVISFAKSREVKNLLMNFPEVE